MRRSRYIRGLILLIGIIVMSCSNRGPQRPSHHSGHTAQADTEAIALMTLNQRMAAEADNQLVQYIEKQSETYALHELSNAWMRHIALGDKEDTPQKDEQWRIHIRNKSLDGQLLLDECREYTIGRNELPICIELACEEIHHGDVLVIVAPWYSAYGMYGNEYIPPYTNVILEIEVL